MVLSPGLESLASLLDGKPGTDVEAEEQEPVNSYLLHEALPLLELGLYPRLADIDYDEFECYDSVALLGYIEEPGRRMWNHGEPICSIQGIPPTCRVASVRRQPYRRTILRGDHVLELDEYEMDGITKLLRIAKRFTDRRRLDLLL